MSSPLPHTAIAVIGAGNAGYAMAAHLALAGYAVRLYELPSFAHNLDPIRAQGGIRLTGVVGEGLAKLERVTSDIEEAISGASHVFVVTQAIAHEMVADLCAPHVEAGQTYVIFPGSGGSLVFANSFRAAGVLDGVFLAETVTLPYSCRIREPGWVNVHAGPGVREIIGVFPARATDAVVANLRAIYPMLTPARHVLEVALYNPNLLLHPIGVIFNLGRIEYANGEFWMYREGFTPSVMKILRALERERVALLRKLDVEPMDFEEFYTYRYGDKWENFAAVSSKGPASAATRYISEDIPMGMVLLSSLGTLLDVPTPTADALIHLGSVIHDTDYRTPGRSVARLGLDGYSAGEILHYLTDGSLPAHTTEKSA